METNSFGEQVGEVFGTVAWLWVFHRFSQDGAVLLGFRHPWEHGDHGDHGHHGDSHGSGHAKEAITMDEAAAKWESFSVKAVIPGEEDEDEVRLVCPGETWGGSYGAHVRPVLNNFFSLDLG